MKIVIAGAGEVGSHLAKMLTQDHHEVTVIDTDEERIGKLSSDADIITVEGNPTSISVLREAGVSKADLYIGVVPSQDQEVNIVSAILAKKLGAKKVTARIKNEEYQRGENRKIFYEMGLDSLFYPERIAANEILDLLKDAPIADYMDYSHGKLQLIVVKLEELSPVIDKTIEEVRKWSKELFRAVAIIREGKTIIPTISTRFRLGDQVYIVASKEGADAAVSISGKEITPLRNVIIVGGGSIGEMVARKVEKNAQNVKIIEIDPERCEFLSENLSRALVINGDGSNRDLLIEEDIEDCDIFVAVTGSSEVNILSCVMAHKMGVNRTIAQVENFEYIGLAEEMGVDSVVNKKLITAGRIFRFTLSNKVRSIKMLGETEAELLEFVVSKGAKITSGPIKDIGFPTNAVIGGYIRGNESFMANGDTVIAPYDQVVVFTTPDVVGQVDSFFL
ncbi:MAG: Trk system potassium transporter TrkA [Bacteroidales bacterium]|nr:Trk system potassium transporter TrkA [Bacteroidales bacterium]